MIQTLLIANRGEIACRIARTARQLGITTVAVYTPADANALHCRQADRAVLINDYLDADALLAAAAQNNADAVHPGCGFLSENATFAEQCRAAGLCFVGPPAQTMRQAASKAAARQLAAAAGIATVPGFDDTTADDSALQQAADALGYPLLIKAAAGGGGRGMRVVTTAETFAAATDTCRREAHSGFGDATIILEKYIQHARHIEVQILADTHGTVHTLGERDCSLQRRYQKVVEETPAPNLSDDLRTQLHQTAKRLAEKINYVGAGTVEFLLDSDTQQLYFLEINARLQVEHPVTEMVYDCDLVAWQLHIAGGAALPPQLPQPQGCAIEVRLCAEDPLHNFLPAGGTVAWRQLPLTAGIRIDSGIADGDVVGEQYDSLLAKIIAHGSNRDEAIKRLITALDNLQLYGVRHNAAFARTLLATTAFNAGTMYTGQIEAEQEAWTTALHTQYETLILLAAVSIMPPSAALAGWRLLAAAQTTLDWTETNRQLLLQVERTAEATLAVTWRDKANDDNPRRMVLDTVHSSADGAGLLVSAVINGQRQQAQVYDITADARTVSGGGLTLRIARSSADTLPVAAPPGGATAPMNAIVSSIAVRCGDTVEKNALLMTLKAMKMEIQIIAPAAGTVTALYVNTDDRVQAGMTLAQINNGEEQD